MKYEQPEVQIIELGEMIITDITYTSTDPTKDVGSLFGAEANAIETFSLR